MQSNIDKTGKIIRLITGAVFEGIGLMLIILAWVGMIPGAGAGAGNWPYYVGVPCVLYGWFAIFEGIAGWCIIRAMGIRTKY